MENQMLMKFMELAVQIAMLVFIILIWMQGRNVSALADHILALIARQKANGGAPV